MAKRIEYLVRVLDDNGQVKLKKEFKDIDEAFERAEKAIDRGNKVTIKKLVEIERFSIEDSSVWGIRNHDPYSFGPKPLSTLFLHTSVTTHLDISASVAEERAQMRNVDNIAFGRGFNGFSYTHGVFQSGRVYEGRGWGVVEAATEEFNTSSDSICFIGNTDAFKPSEASIEAVIATIKDGQKKGFLVKQGLNIRGHREVAAKACPGQFVTEAIVRGIERAVNVG